VVEDFVSAARRFCALIEASSPLSGRVGLPELEQILAAVYAAGVRLPGVEPEGDDVTISRMSDDEWRSLFEELRRRLGDADRYWTFLDPSIQTSLVEASLADDLADIYRELAGGIDLLRSGAAPDEVLFRWRLGLDLHWGRHAVAALRALRALVERA
jgi:hypothetical protein